MKIKASPEEFKVEEILKEKPGKEKGKFRYYRLKKRGVETSRAIERIAKVSGVPKGEILYGGIKDKNAETVQFIAVKEPLKLKEISEKGLKVEFAGWHNKTPRELLKGNSFKILVREAKEPPKERLKVLRTFGIPNYYGEQRFTPVRKGKLFVEEWLNGAERAVKYLFTPAGWESSASRRAKKLFSEGRFKEAAKSFGGWRRRVCNHLAEGGSWKGALRLIPKEEIEFQLNVFQSFLFNELLSRLVGRSAQKPLKFKYKLGWLLYPAEEVRLLRELPSFTPKVEIYDQILKERGIERERLRELAPLFHSFSRKTVVKPKKFSVRKSGEGLWLTFSLPAGAYATNLLRFLFNAV